MRYSLIRTYDTADGPGLRTAVYFSGCQRALDGHACPGCHNSIAWEKESGKEWTADVKAEVLKSIEPSYVSGLSVLGGEPLSDFNLDGVLDLVHDCKEKFPQKEIWMWTGYNLTEVMQDPKKKLQVLQILEYVDYVVDGPFVQDLKEPELKFRGSTNQHILKVQHDNSLQTVVDVTDQM